MPALLTKTFTFSSLEGWAVGFEGDTSSSEYTGSLASLSSSSLLAEFRSSDTVNATKNFYVTCELSPTNFGIPQGAVIQSIRFISAATKYVEGPSANSLTIGQVDVYKPASGTTLSLYNSSRTVNSNFYESSFVVTGPGSVISGTGLDTYQTVGTSFAKVRIKSTVTSKDGEAKSYGFLFDDISFEISYLPPPRVANAHLINSHHQMTASGVSLGFTRTSTSSTQSKVHTVAGIGAFPPSLQGRYVAIIDDSTASPEFTTTGSQFAAIDPFDDMQSYRVNYQNTQLVAATRDGTSQAIYTFDDLPIGQYDIWATWDSWQRTSPSSAAATNTPYAIYDGAFLLQTHPVDQTQPPVANPEFPDAEFSYDLNANGTKWRKVGSHTIVQGSMVVKVANTGDGPIYADAVRISSAGDECLGESTYTDNFGDGVIGGEWDISHGTWSESAGILSQTSIASADKKAWNWYYEWSPTELEVAAKVRVDAWTDGSGSSRAGVSLNINELGLGYNLIFEGSIGGSFTGKNKLVFLDDGISYGSSYVFPWTLGTWYWFKLKRSGAMLYGKVWADGDSEPATYPYSQTLGAPFSNRDYGYPGLTSGNNSSKASFDDVTITPSLSFTGCAGLKPTRSISNSVVNETPPIEGSATYIHHKTLTGAGERGGQEFRGSTTLPGDLVHFTFEETGTSVIDWSGRGRTGTLVGLDPVGSRLSPGGVQFGVSGQVAFPEVILEAPATICFSWTSMGRNGLKRSICMLDGTHGFYIGSDNKFTWTDHEVTIKADVPVEQYSRHHVALTISETGTATIYVDGVIAGTPVDGALQTYMALNNLGTMVDPSVGIIYDFQALDQELTAEDVAALAVAGTDLGSLRTRPAIQGTGERTMPVYTADVALHRVSTMTTAAINDIPTSVGGAVISRGIGFTSTGESLPPVYEASSSCDIMHACTAETRGSLYQTVTMFIRATNNSEWLNRMTLITDGDNHVYGEQPLFIHGYDKPTGLTAMTLHTLSVSDPQINVTNLVVPQVTYPLARGQATCFIRGGSTSEIRLGQVTQFHAIGSGVTTKTTPMFVKVADAINSNMPLVIKGPLGLNGTASLFIQAPRGSTKSLNLFLSTLPAPSASGSCHLYIGNDVLPRGVLPLALTGWNSPVEHSMNLYMRGVDEGRTSRILNFRIEGGNARTHGSAPLFLFNNPPENSFVELYIEGTGMYAGRVPCESNLGLYLERGAQAGMCLSVENHDVVASANLFIRGVPSISEYVPFYIMGDGGVVTQEVSLVIPEVYVPTILSDSMILVVPNTTAQKTGRTPLYISGWRR